tara:strand:+ start:12370 stop:12555 length:186 start_codon:yes stop_codon:yes gene_type:complete
MANITIDGNDYNLDDLSERAKQQLGSIQFVENEIKKFEAQINIYKTARASFTAALKQELDS